ncbi:hypothetical protein J2S90_004781 [Arthrobacter bambusae]|uniref:Uncharacterized protein n=1 Tax=Arthrobacter bambusae TaxID=1338426 RepID=A0AAW8DN90_9MICC|nr:hypothetical protein [Arthrobacter bambusae]MDQ0130596.1 hypothetical protein [Arthrobacter bambusae]MDQ0181985.1 hypothetical protein [Arthrobacter bambusae]
MVPRSPWRLRVTVQVLGLPWPGRATGTGKRQLQLRLRIDGGAVYGGIEGVRARWTSWGYLVCQ